jgi:preprotein translocase subunit YajC
MLGLLHGERVRVRLVRGGSLVGEVVQADATGIRLELSDGTIATVPSSAIVSVRERAAWTRPA